MPGTSMVNPLNVARSHGYPGACAQLLDLELLQPGDCGQFDGASRRRCQGARVGLSPCQYDERSKTCLLDEEHNCSSSSPIHHNGDAAWRPPPWRPPPGNSSRETVIRFTHIPKTAGTSVYSTLERAGYSVPGTHQGQERCFDAPGLCGKADCRGGCGRVRCIAQEGQSVVNLVVLRSPRSHVISQYYECRYSIWGRFTTGMACNVHSGAPCAEPRTPFARLFVHNKTFVQGLHAWVSWFARTPSAPANEFGCYNPRNFQSRALTCQRPDIFGSHNEAAGQAGLPAEAEAAIAALGRVDVLGLTELFRESICVLHFNVHGVVPPDCECIPGEEADPRRFNESHIWDAIGEAEAEPAGLPAETSAAIDALTREDSTLYAAALPRLMRDVWHAERVTGVRMLCR